MLHNSKLEAKVTAVNKAHEYANKLSGELIEYFKGFVGKKIFNANGGLLAKITSDMSELSIVNPALVYHNKSSYFLSFHIKTTESYKTGRDDDTIAEYYTASIYIGDVSNGVLVNINAVQPQYKTDFTVEMIEERRAEYKRLQNLADAALGELHPFGE